MGLACYRSNQTCNCARVCVCLTVPWQQWPLLTQAFLGPYALSLFLPLLALQLVVD